METMTPGQLAIIVVGTLVIIFGRMAWDWRNEIAAGLRRVIPARRYVTQPAPQASPQIAVSPRPDAVRENVEIGKPLGPTPAELDRMLADARAEAIARAVGTLAGAGLLAPGSRSKALLALGIEGRRYQLLKPLVDAAQAAAQAELAPPAEPPRVIRVFEGREGLERELPMEPAP